jgi:hypothetical protein
VVRERPIPIAGFHLVHGQSQTSITLSQTDMKSLLLFAGLCVLSAVTTAGQPDGKAPAQFTTEARWDTAGYNNDEIVYTIILTSHDSRVIRCTTSLQGSYYENGQKQSVSDRQLSTVFPDQQVQVGNWMGMDKQSGATYSVHCHPM